MLLRADAGSTPANPRSDTIANAVTATLQDIPNVSRNHLAAEITLTSAADFDLDHFFTVSRSFLRSCC